MSARPRLPLPLLPPYPHHHPPYFPRTAPRKEHLPDQQHHFLRSPLETLQPGRQEAPLPAARNLQTQRPKAGHKLSLIKPIAVIPPPLLLLVRSSSHILVPLTRRLCFQELLP